MAIGYLRPLRFIFRLKRMGLTTAPLVAPVAGLDELHRNLLWLHKPGRSSLSPPPVPLPDAGDLEARAVRVACRLSRRCKETNHTDRLHRTYRMASMA
jgi:hypothetical protein